MQPGVGPLTQDPKVGCSLSGPVSLGLPFPLLLLGPFLRNHSINLKNPPPGSAFLLEWWGCLDSEDGGREQGEMEGGEGRALGLDELRGRRYRKQPQVNERPLHGAVPQLLTRVPD